MALVGFQCRSLHGDGFGTDQPGSRASASIFGKSPSDKPTESRCRLVGAAHSVPAAAAAAAQYAAPSAGCGFTRFANRTPEPPSNRLPIHARAAELLRLRTPPRSSRTPAIPMASNPRVHEGERTSVPNRDLAHGLIERISRAIGVAFGRPQVAAAQLVTAVGLVLIYCTSTAWHRRRSEV